jgi:hypothetical protein
LDSGLFERRDHLERERLFGTRIAQENLRALRVARLILFTGHDGFLDPFARPPLRWHFLRRLETLTSRISCWSSAPGVCYFLPISDVGINLGITGHLDSNPAFVANRERIAEALTSLFATIDTVAARHLDDDTVALAPTRIHSLLAQGADLLAMEIAQSRGWETVAPLPFGERLNLAINALPKNAEDAQRLLEGTSPSDPEVAARAAKIVEASRHARLFQLADQDETLRELYLRMLSNRRDEDAAERYALAVSRQVGLAGRIMIEQSDLLIGIWDGESPGRPGGTKHTMVSALNQDIPVIWINAHHPEGWRILRSAEPITNTQTVPTPQADNAALAEIIIGSLATGVTASSPDSNTEARHEYNDLDGESWHPHSNRLFHAYRWVEATFGRQKGDPLLSKVALTYETPHEIEAGSAAEFLETAQQLPGADPGYAQRIATLILRRFAWADGISTYLSDAYRGGMVITSLMAAFAVILGIAYIPLASNDEKWIFALIELALLISILTIIYFGRRRRWHNRWFETRRVAEYLRHAPILLLLGISRSAARWPKGTASSWPETHARQLIRRVGLPQVSITSDYLIANLVYTLGAHVRAQHEYHADKARRLTAAHRNLDRLSEGMFIAAVVAVALFLLLYFAGETGLIPASVAYLSSKTFTFLGVLFPTLGGAIAGIRYFGDFERFAAISEVTAEKLGAIRSRIDQLLARPDDPPSYAIVADIGHDIDNVVFDEIENWQAVFAGKQITIPV